MTEIKITRRATIDADFNYYEFEATYDTAKDKGNKIIKDIERTVTFARAMVASTKESKPPKKKAKKAPEIPTKKPVETPTEDVKITDLKAGDKVNMSVRFLKLGELKPFVRDGKVASYCKCYVEDDSGQMQMTLFDEQIALLKDVKENAWLQITNGYVKEWQGKLELVVSKWGKMEVVYNG